MYVKDQQMLKGSFISIKCFISRMITKSLNLLCREDFSWDRLNPLQQVGVLIVFSFVFLDESNFGISL